MSQTLQSVFWAPRWLISVLFTRVSRRNGRLTLLAFAAQFVPSSGFLSQMTRSKFIPIHVPLLPLPAPVPLLLIT